jgi:purine-nucleoside phosphorylase
MAADPFAEAKQAASELVAVLGPPPPDVALILGSGWGQAVPELGEPVASVPMAKLAGFPAPTVPGHAGTASIIEVAGHRVLVLAGRTHLYEGGPVAVVVHPVRSAVLAGCKTVVLTNAAGSLRTEWPVGRPVLIADHLNLTGHSPLVGPAPPPDYPSRFVDLSAAYSPRLRDIARRVDPSLAEGVYAALLGGAFETPAEIRMLRTLGADLVGMSTALETIAAVHLGAEVLGVSLVTNLAAGLSPGRLDHQEVLAAGSEAAAPLGRLLRTVIERV